MVAVVAVVAIVGIGVSLSDPNPLFQVHALDVQLFGRMCQFLGKLGLLTVSDVWVFRRTKDYLYSVVQKVRMLVRHNQ